MGVFEIVLLVVGGWLAIALVAYVLLVPWLRASTNGSRVLRRSRRAEAEGGSRKDREAA